LELPEEPIAGPLAEALLFQPARIAKIGRPIAHEAHQVGIAGCKTRGVLADEVPGARVQLPQAELVQAGAGIELLALKEEAVAGAASGVAEHIAEGVVKDEVEK